MADTSDPRYADSIHATALTRGLTPHQADIAAALVPFVEGASRIERGLRDLMSGLHSGGDIRANWTNLSRQLDELAGKASSAIAVELARRADALGLSLTVPQGDRFYDLMLKLAYIAHEDSAQRARAIEAIIDFCKTAPAAKAGA